MVSNNPTVLRKKSSQTSEGDSAGYASDCREAYLDRQQQVCDEYLEDERLNEELFLKEMKELTMQGHVGYKLHSYGRDGLTCFATAMRFLGLDSVAADATSPRQLTEHERELVVSRKREYFVYVVKYGEISPFNHVELVEVRGKASYSRVEPAGGSGNELARTVAVTSLEEFVKPGSQWFEGSYYSQDAPGERFGQDLETPMFVEQPALLSSRGVTGGSAAVGSQGMNVGSTGASGGMGGLAPPVSESSVGPGSANLTGGVVRRKRRQIKGVVAYDAAAAVAKNYRTASGVMFNNADELFQDSISRDFAQEIIEDLFSKWGLPTDQPEAMKYAEDLLFLFLITNTASNKSDYQKQYEIPVKPFDREGERVTEVVADFKVFSDILASSYAISRRQFSRGVADDQHAYLKQPENSQLLPILATRVGCDPQLAPYAFDGSTHCKGMTTREVTFTKLLEARNLFEDDSVIASGASDRLMQGVSGGPRSIQPR